MPSVKHYSSSEVNQYELSSRLLSLTENTSYTLTQINGQRIYRKAPHAWNGPEPSRNCEVFIGRIPHDCFEDTLVPLFQQAGELFEFRLMINFSGWNRGYAFAMYTLEVEACNAIQLFNNYMIRPSWQLGVCPSINNCRIFISRIPASTPSVEVVRLLYALTDEVSEVRIRRSVASCAAIVEYKSHRGAAMARKALVAAAAAAWGGGARPAVDWSLPQSPQLLKQYREIGRWSAEHGVELARAPDETCAPLAAGAGAPSYTLEPWSQARRLRMIHAAQRTQQHAHQHQHAGAATAAAAAAAPTQRTQEWSPMSDNVLSLSASMSALALQARERAVWSPPPQPPPRAHLLQHQSPPLPQPQPRAQHVQHLPPPQSLQQPRAQSPPQPQQHGQHQLPQLQPRAQHVQHLPPPQSLQQPRALSPPQPQYDFNPWTARHPMQEFMRRRREAREEDE